MGDKLIAYFKDILSEQMLADSEKMDHILDLEDVTLEDIVAVWGQNSPKIEKMANGKFIVTATVKGMTAYAGGAGSGTHKTRRGYARSEVETRFIKGYYTMTHEQLTAIQNDSNAALNAADDFATGIRKAMMAAKARSLRGDGTGIGWVLPVGEQVGTEITISTRSPWALATHNIYGLGTDEFEPGTKIVFGTKAQLAQGEAGTAVEAEIDDIIDWARFQLTSSVTVGNPAGANNRGGTNANTVYIVRGTKKNNEYNNAPIGLFGLIDDGTLVPELQWVDRSTASWMRSIVRVKENANTIVTDFQELYTEFRKWGKPEYFRVSTDVYAKYTSALTLTAQQTRGDYKTKIGSGHTWIAFTYGNTKELPILQDLFLPHWTVFLIDPRAFFEASLFSEDFVPGYFMKPIDAEEWLEYETVRAAYINFGTWGSRGNWARILYQSV